MAVLAKRQLQTEAAHAAVEGDDEQSQALIARRGETNMFSNMQGLQEAFHEEDEEDVAIEKVLDQLLKQRDEAEQAEGADGEDGDTLAKRFVKNAILDSTNSKELLERAEGLIKEDWLAPLNTLPGNIYSMGGLRRVRRELPERDEILWFHVHHADPYHRASSDLVQQAQQRRHVLRRWKRLQVGVLVVDEHLRINPSGLGLLADVLGPHECRIRRDQYHTSCPCRPSS
jgi:hypothetical protein